MTEGMLAGRTALVTGASRGIGAAIAIRLATEGAKVAVTARTVSDPDPRFPGTINDTVRSIESAGGTAVAVQADLSRPEDRERMAGAVRAALGTVDILVNNAAVTFFAPILDFTDRRCRLMFEVQVHAPVHLAQMFAPDMVERGQGWVVNISSGAARHPTVGSAFGAMGGTVYGMCKAALERFTTGLAAELYESNVAVNAVSPNQVVPTPGTLHHHLVTRDTPEDSIERPEVMAEATLALCSRSPKDLTGRVAYSQDLLRELSLPFPR